MTAACRDIVLMTADDSARTSEAAEGARKLLGQGAEVIIGPLFAASVTAVAPVARDHGVPVIAFSTDRSVAGNGVYLLSFQPESEVKRVISYAAEQGRKNFAALIPSTAYGKVSETAFREAVKASGGTVGLVEHFSPSAGATEQAGFVAKSGPDAVFIPQGGATLRAIAPALVSNGVDVASVKLLGTGLWDDPAVERRGVARWLVRRARAERGPFLRRPKYREAFGAAPPQLAALAYDAMSLIALVGAGQPYHRFTKAALTDPNGFAGVDGIFRFDESGAIERGLSVLAVRPGGFDVVSPAPTTFEGKGS